MRRRIAAALGALALAVAPSVVGMPTAAAGESPPAEQLSTTTPIKHFVVLMQSNHSFDNYFGTYPGADGIPAATCMPVPAASTSSPKRTPPCAKPFPLRGSAISNLGQNRAIYDAEYNGGKMDGFVSAFGKHAGVAGQAMGYYDRQDIPYYWNVADNYVLFDRLFTSASGGSVWNHMFWVTGTPGNPNADALSTTGLDAVPTIFDALQKAGISWKFYAQNYRPKINFRTRSGAAAAAQRVRVPLLNYNRFLDDPTLSSHIVDMSQYYKDLDDGRLPAVSFMVPSGPSEHPPSSIKAGQSFVRTLINSLMSSSSWKTSAFMWTYDGWGGWYDHVKPPAVDKYGYGFRSPALLVSPYAKKGYIDHTTLDFTSELKFIENNWRVPPLAARDKAANDITSAFDFSAAPREAALLGNGPSATRPPVGRISAVYPSYGGALLLLAVLVVVAALRGRKVRTGVSR
jgi:phospholipase C